MRSGGTLCLTLLLLLGTGIATRDQAWGQVQRPTVRSLPRPVQGGAQPKLQNDPAAALPVKTGIRSPDLVVTIEPAGESHKITVKNQGLGTSGATNIRLSCYWYDGYMKLGPCPDWERVWKPLASLTSGQEVDVHEPSCYFDSVYNLGNDRCRITVAADPGDEVTEIDETNNSGSYYIP